MGYVWKFDMYEPYYKGFIVLSPKTESIKYYDKECLDVAAKEYITLDKTSSFLGLVYLYLKYLRYLMFLVHIK